MQMGRRIPGLDLIDPAEVVDGAVDPARLTRRFICLGKVPVGPQLWTDQLARVLGAAEILEASGGWELVNVVSSTHGLVVAVLRRRAGTSA